MRVYRLVERREEICQYGSKHNVYVYAGKDIEDTGRRYMYDNGYTNESEKIYKDRQGQFYFEHSPIDFYGGPSFVVYESDGQTCKALFKRSVAGYAIDVLGRKI